MSWRPIGYGGAPAPGRDVRVPHTRKKIRPVNLDAIGGLPRIARDADPTTPYPPGRSKTPNTASGLMSFPKVHAPLPVHVPKAPRAARTGLTYRNGLGHFGRSRGMM